MNEKSSISIKLGPDRRDIEFLRSRLEEYNLACTQDQRDVPLLLSITGDQDELLAGLYARIYYSWMFVELLWVAKEARGRGFGAKLLAQAEEQARQHGCHSAWLDTFSFQAPEFYRKRGYEVFGELPGYPAEHRRYFLCKKLS
jgi:GNAT superfamily N-acetyltransferase